MSEKEGTLSQSMYGYGPKITRHEGQGNGGNYLDFTDETINAILASPTGGVEKVTYANAAGPIGIKVVDPLNVPNAEFSVKFIAKKYYAVADSAKKYACDYNANALISHKNTNHSSIMSDSVTWVLKNTISGKEYVPCKSIKVGEEFYFPDLGLSVNIGQVKDIGGPLVASNSNTDRGVVQQGDLISASMTFADPTKSWLTGVTDRDGVEGYNWIRSGGVKSTPSATNDDDYGYANPSLIDPDQIFEGILGGTWAPYVLTAAGHASVLAAPASSLSSSLGNISTQHDLRGLASVDIVLTSDKSKWTRAMVLEQCDVQASNPNGGRKLEVKRRLSVDKQGIAWNAPGANVSEGFFDTLKYGCGWFPGYAINLETGERLQIAFGEDSYQTGNNGDDMMWNPTTTEELGNSPYPFLAGRHYIYVFGHNRSNSRYKGVTVGGGAINNNLIGVGAYTEQNFKEFVSTYKWSYNLGISGANALKNIWTDAMWVNVPKVKEDRFLFKNPSSMPCEVKVKLRVKKAYKTRTAGMANINLTSQLTSFSQASLINSVATSNGTLTSISASLSSDSVASPVNNNMPYYTFSTADIFAEINNADQHKNSLDLINVVPNPYYAYSQYETNRIDNRIRITNVPNKCKIKIFTLNGTLVRTFNRDVSGQEDVNTNDIGSDFIHSKRLPYQDWDLKNQSGITVASGLYIIHIDVPGVGEKILKWFGVMRPLDLQSY